MPRPCRTHSLRQLAATLRKGGVVVCGLLACAHVMAAGVYRWVDDEGVTHYSDVPEGVAEGAVIEVLEVQSRPTDTAKVAAQVEQQRERYFEEQSREQQARTDTAEQDRLAKETAAERAENCKVAEQRLETYMNSRRLYRPQPDGGREYLTDQEMDEQRAKARRDVEQWCD